MNLVLIVLTALLALGAAVPSHHPAASAVTGTVSGATTAPVVAPLATATGAPTPTPNDVISGGGPSH